MLIVGDEILKLKLLLDADTKHIKNSSYYLTIGSIIPAGEEARKYDFSKPNTMLVIRPRQVAWVVSKEVFNIKSHDITALVTLRSTFTKQGLLALDVGMVDPDFEGPIGSIVINFSKNDVSLKAGEEFFRVVFVRHPEVPASFREPREKTSATEYAKKRHDEIIRGFPDTFLNTEVLSDDIAAKITEKVSANILDRVLLHLLKKHWWKLLIGILVFGAAVAYAVYQFYLHFGPELTREDIQAIVKTWVEQNLPKEVPPQ